MFRSIDDFTTQWNTHAADTLKIFGAMTDASLTQGIAEGHRNLGRLAWHLVVTIPEMAQAVGLAVTGPGQDSAIPADVNSICRAYEKAAASLAAAVKEQWSDADLLIEDDLYGETWKRGFTIYALICHEIHHRGQMTVLMRQAGLKVPGVYGPALEDWSSYNADPPKI